MAHLVRSSPNNVLLVSLRRQHLVLALVLVRLIQEHTNVDRGSVQNKLEMTTYRGWLGLTILLSCYKDGNECCCRNSDIPCLKMSVLSA
jgi:hypothetical protein